MASGTGNMALVDMEPGGFWNWWARRGDESSGRNARIEEIGDEATEFLEGLSSVRLAQNLSTALRSALDDLEGKYRDFKIDCENWEDQKRCATERERKVFVNRFNRKKMELKADMLALQKEYEKWEKRQKATRERDERLAEKKKESEVEIAVKGAQAMAELERRAEEAEKEWNRKERSKQSDLQEMERKAKIDLERREKEMEHELKKLTLELEIAKLKSGSK